MGIWTFATPRPQQFPAYKTIAQGEIGRRRWRILVGVLHACYSNTAALPRKERNQYQIRIRKVVGARDLNPRPHGPEP